VSLARVTNAGIVVEADGITVIDMIRSRTEACAAAIEDRPACTAVVLTSSHVPYVERSRSFPAGRRHRTSQISAHLDQPPNIEGYQRLYPTWPRHSTCDSPPSHVVTGDLAHAGDHTVPRRPDRAEPRRSSAGSRGGVRQGDVLVRRRPLAFDGIAAWARLLDRIVELAERSCPGQGPWAPQPMSPNCRVPARLCPSRRRQLGAGPWDK
jgi:hypothetical protein